MPNLSRNGELVQFRINLEAAARITLRVFALTGEEVYSVSQQGQAGANNLWWNLENQAGSNLASGLYLYRVEVEGVAGSFFKTGKVVLLH